VSQGKTIVIDPVTRIEGHSKITLHLNEDGRVEDFVGRHAFSFSIVSAGSPSQSASTTLSASATLARRTWDSP